MSADSTHLPPPWRVTGDGIALSVRLQPKASRDAIDGIAALADGTRSLRVRVRALPAKGAANKALIKLLAKALGFARSDLEIGAGAKDRNKTVRIAGDPAELAQLIAERLAKMEREDGDD